MRYNIVYLINNSDQDYKDFFDGEEYIVPAQGFAILVDRVGNHFLNHNPKLELLTDFEACQARLSQLGFSSYEKSKKEPEEPTAEVSPET